MAVQHEITLAVESFKWNELALHEVLMSPAGPVARDVIRRAVQVETAAKQSMGQVAPPSAPGRPPAVRTGRLRGSITWRLGVDLLGPYADIGTAVIYGRYLELGTAYIAPRPFLTPALHAAWI